MPVSVNLIIDEIEQPITITQPTNTLTVDAPPGDNTLDITQDTNEIAITVGEPTIAVAGDEVTNLTINTFDVTVSDDSTIVSLDITMVGDQPITVTSGTNNVSVATQQQSLEVLSGFGTGLVEFQNAIDDIYAFYGSDAANTVTNSRFFTSLDGWDIDGCDMVTGLDPDGQARVQNDDPDVPSGIPFQYVARMGGKYARYTGKRLNVITGETIYAEVLSVTPVPGTAQQLFLKVFYYNDANTKVGEQTVAFRSPSATPGRMGGQTTVPLYSPSEATQAEFVLETDSILDGYDPLKRWYFTNGKLFSAANTEVLQASIDEINTILYDPITGLTAQYSLKLNVDGRITGIYANATSTVTDFTIVTDKFFVVDPTDDGNFEQVFEIVDGVVKLRELIANDITSTTINVKNNGVIKVFDSQVPTPVARVEIGKIGSDYGLLVRNAAGAIIFNVDSLGANVVGNTNIISGAVTAGKTSIAAINSGTGNLNSNTVDTAQIIAGAISDASKFSTTIRPVEVVGTLPVSGNFTGRTVFLTTDQKLYRYNGSAYTAAVPTTDLSGQIINGQIANNAVDAAAIAAGAVTAVKTALASINSSTGNLNANTVNTAQIVASAVDANSIAAGAVTAVKTALAAINSSSGNLNANTVTATNIVAGTITTTQIAANTIVAGNIAANTITSGQIAANTITAGQIAANTITAGQIAANTITASQIAANTITASQILAGTITTTEIAANTIVAGNIAAATITSTQIAASTITAGNIAANTITAGQIAANTITAGQIAAATITGDRIAANTITASRILVTNAYNMIADADLRDTNYWTFGGGSTINTADSIITSNMGIRAAFKSATGNGTLSQTASTAQTPSIMVEPSKSYRFSSRFAVGVGFTGVNIIYINWYKQDGTASAITPLSSISGTDYRSVAAASITVQTVDAQIVSPSDAYFCRVQPTSQWSTTINNGGVGYQGLVFFNRANSGELIVDGSIVAAKIAANTITASQIAAGTITATEIAAGTITASRLTITSDNNKIADPDLRDLSYWSVGTGWTINSSDSVVTTNLQARAAWKSPAGNGTTSQATVGVATSNMLVEPGKVYRIASTTLVTTGFTGLMYLFISWFKRDSTASSTPVSTLTTTNYKTVAAGSNIIQVLDAQFTAPSDAYYARWQPVVEWSTTLNNAGNVYAAFPQFNRVTDGVLIADGTVTAVKIAANTITASQIAAGTITATQIAAGTITSAQIATDTIRSSTWNNSTKAGWLLGTNGDIQASSITIYKPGVTPVKIFSLDGMSYDGTNSYQLNDIITKISKASEDGSPDTQIFDGTNPDTWIDLCDIAITAKGSQNIDIDINTDMLVEQLFDPSINLKYAAGVPDFRYRLRRTQGATVDLKVSEWFKLSTVGQIPTAIFPVLDSTATTGSATYLMQAQWRKGTYTTGTISKSVNSSLITGTGVSWLANIGQSGGISEAGFPGIRASGSWSFSGQPANGNTITVNGVVFTFVTSGATGNQANIGGSLSATIGNMVTVLNASANSSVNVATYFNNTTALAAFYDTVGTAGNAFTLAKVGTNITVSGANMTGGTDPVPVPWEIRVTSVDPNWWPINTISKRTELIFNPDTADATNALYATSLSGASYEVRANYHAVIMRLKNYTIRTTEYRNTAVI